MAGLLLLGIGTLLLVKELGVPFPTWFFTWPMILIALGLLIGTINRFRDPGWIIICIVGFAFLFNKIWPGVPILPFVWPVLIIAVGLIIILAPRHKRKWHERFEEDQPEDIEQPVTTPVEPVATEAPVATETVKEKRGDDWMDIISFFGNIKKNVYSKDFRGGDIVSVFGGAEVNLMRADFEGQIVIEMVQIFGGAKLIVPPHWQIRSEMVAVFGGIEDKRTPQATYDSNKVVILNGTTFFGGIEIKSY